MRSPRSLFALAAVTALAVGVPSPVLADEPAPPAPAGRGRERVLLVVDDGDGYELAERTRDAFVERGFVRADRVVVVHERSAHALATAIGTIDAHAAGIAPRDLTLFAVVLSGTGAGAETADEVAQRLAKVPAIARVVLSRACDAAPQARVSRGEGHLRVALGGTCGEADPMRTLLLGQGGAADVDDDHLVTVAEAVQFVADEAQAARLPLAIAVDRTPPELGIVLGHDASFPEGAELVLPRSPRPAFYRIYVHGEAHPVAVAHARTDRDVRVRVPVGRLVVHALAARGARGIDLRIGKAEVNHLGETEGRAMERADLDADGGVLTKPVHELSVAYGGGLGGYASFSHGAALRYSYAMPTHAFSVVGSAALGGTENPVNENLFTTFGLRVRAERRFFSGTPLVAFGAGLVGELPLQSLHRNDASLVAGTGYAVIERYRAGAFGPEVYANLRTTVGGTSFFGAEVAAVFPFAPSSTDNLQSYPRLEGSLYAGLCF